MNIVFLDGNPKVEANAYKRHIEELKALLESEQHQVNVLNLQDMNIKYCTGCWSCWWGPTPGECVFKDESGIVCREYINSDLVIFLSPIIMGFTSSLLKKVQDKLIPLVHPYIELVNGECHHIKRYDRYPLIGLILAKGSDADAEDVEIITDMFRRFALNLKSKLAFSLLTEQSIREVKDAVNSI